MRQKRALKTISNPGEMGFLSREDIEAIGFASVGENVLIDNSAARFYGAERISLGSNIRIDAFVILSAGRDGITIGNYIHIGAAAFMSGAAQIKLGNFANVSGRVSIYSSSDDFHGNALTGPTIPKEFRSVRSAPVTLQEHAIIGSGSVVLPGVTLGKGAAVGALTLVKHDVPPLTIIAGPKGKVIGKRNQQLLKLERKLKEQYG